MPRRPGPLKRVTTVNLLDATLDLMKSKAEATGLSVSELVNIACVEKYTPRRGRGLAKQLEQRKADARLRYEQTIREATEAAEAARIATEQQLAKQLAEATEAAEAARIATEQQLEHIKFTAQELLACTEAETNSEWQNSYQAMLLSLNLDDSVTNEKQIAISDWLLARRVLAVRDKFGVWQYGTRLSWSALSFMTSEVLPDKLQAADLAADAETCEVSADAWDFLLSNYEHDEAKLIDALKSISDFDLLDCPVYELLTEAEELFACGLRPLLGRLGIEVRALVAAKEAGAWQTDSWADRYPANLGS